MHFLSYSSLLTALLATPFLAAIQVPQNGSTIYQSLFAVHSNSTPIFHNVSRRTANPLIKALQGANGIASLQKRDNGLPVGTCAPGTPCSNGACCSKTGICGFSPTECGVGNCISNCDAKAECGQYAAAGSEMCPINVCCSKFGFCGTTEEFCGTGCQSGFGGCGAAKRPFCAGQSATQRTIGYYEGWSATRACDKRLPSDLDVSGLTHINFAFAYFHPSTFEILPMSAEDMALYPKFTELKAKKPALQVWISIGGWAFNDATNSPNTQTAFSDMTKSAANRQKFIQSLINFMATWGFDGVDLDWEYPGADDRGGVRADTANFVLLLKDLKDAFRSQYGLSVTLPASYWYLRWFDLSFMQNYVDFFNVMTYDIHGVWDSTNKNTGPYVRPHTNLTEVVQGLDLLWRNTVDPSKVNMGIGWYGRSFTLQDPGCTKPGCVFKHGGKAGECTRAPGTLSNAEIQRIIQRRHITPILDREAGVKWVTFDDQWVSYDDGETIQMKMDLANKLCLGGTLIWSLDQDGADHISSNDFAGLGITNGVSPEDAATLKKMEQIGERAATVRNSCYWSFCGEECVAGYFPQTYAKGQVAGIQRDTTCKGGQVQTLCCAPGTKAGTCSWNGWRGVGMPCDTNYCPSSDMDLIATNTNSYEDKSDEGAMYDLTCNGGSQSYCCSGFVPSPYRNTDSLNLLGRDHTKRAAKTASDPMCLKGAESIISLLGGSASLVWVLPGSPLAGNSCTQSDSTSAADEYAGVIAQQIGQGALGPNGIHTKPKPKPKPKPQGKPDHASDSRGRYRHVTYGKKDKDCSVTYTCEYGLGFDEVCDNQRWAIDKGLSGLKVYHKAARRPGRTHKDFWYLERKKEYNSLARNRIPSGRQYCEVDEFPMAALVEGGTRAYQVVRFLNGDSNGKQGQDWDMWLKAVYKPCADLRKARGLPDPPITWAFGTFSEGDPRASAKTTGEHFLKAYGFDSQTHGSECWATYTYTINDGTYTSTVSDQGFRAKTDDPLFYAPYNWPKFNRYDKDPSSPDNLPSVVHDSQWWKREIARSVLQNELPLSAIYEAEKAADLVRSYSVPQDPIATSVLADKIAEDQVNQPYRRRSFQNDSPVETSAAKPDSTMVQRRKRHFQRHQDPSKHHH